MAKTRYYTPEDLPSLHRLHTVDRKIPGVNLGGRNWTFLFTTAERAAAFVARAISESGMEVRAAACEDVPAFLQECEDKQVGILLDFEKVEGDTYTAEILSTLALGPVPGQEAN